MQTTKQEIEEIKEYLADKTLMNNSVQLTTILLEAGIELNMVCLFVKDYQKKYVSMKKEGATSEILKEFTPSFWFKHMLRN